MPNFDTPERRTMIRETVEILTKVGLRRLPSGQKALEIVRDCAGELPIDRKVALADAIAAAIRDAEDA